MNIELSYAACLVAMILSVLVADISQIMLKKAAVRTYARWIDQYLNPLVIFAYVLFVVSTVCSVLGYQKLPLSMMPLWNASGQFFVTLFAYLFLGERPSKKKLLGLGIVLVGIVVFSL